MKRILSIFLAVIILSITSITFADEVTKFTFELDIPINRESLTGRQNTITPFSISDSVIEVIANAILNLDDTINISSYGVKASEIVDLMEQVLDCNPKIFYYGEVAGSQINGIVYELDLLQSYTKALESYTYTNLKAKIQEMQALLDSKAEDVIKTCIKPDMSDFEKELSIHDYIVLNCEYDPRYTPENPENVPYISHTAYGAIIEKVAVCDGYARAMQLFMDRLFIPCVVVTGTAAGGGHAWNMVQIDGKWYQLDVTWNDPVPDRKGYLNYKYFNVTDDYLQQNQHIWDTSAFMTATDTRFDYLRDMLYPVRDSQNFYFLFNDTSLNKISIFGGSSTVILNKRAVFNQLYGDTIYFSNYSFNGFIFSVNKDGSNLKQINNIYSKYLYIDGNVLNYYNDTTKANEQIYLVKTLAGAGITANSVYFSKEGVATGVLSSSLDANVDIKNNSTNLVTAMVTVAAYSSDDRLIKTWVDRETLSANASYINSISLDVPDHASYAKIIILNGLAPAIEPVIATR